MNSTGAAGSLTNGPSNSGASNSNDSASGAASSGSSGSSGAMGVLPPQSQVLDKKRLQELVKEVDPNEQLDEDVEELLLHIADDFIEQTVAASCALARHRKAPSVDVRDVQHVLERNFNMWIPGFGTEDIRGNRRSAMSESHKSRMALIRKALKKY